MGKKREHGVELDSPEKKKIKTEVVDDEVKIKQDESIVETVTEGDIPYKDKLKFCSVIAKPMAGKKLAKKLFKLIKKASKQKTYLRSGLKDVQRRIRKGETGLVIFAGDVTPIDVMSHMPILCEDKNIPYCYVPLRDDISKAMGVRRPCLMALVRFNDEYADSYKECEALMKDLPIPYDAKENGSQ